MEAEKLKELIGKMTLEEKAAFCSGADFWHTEGLTVSVEVTNTGSRVGKEVVQLYVADKESTVMRPVKELRDFAKVELQPGETKTVTFTLGKRAFAYYSTQIHDWHVESGEFTVMIGKSSRNIVLQEDVYVESTVTIPVHYTTDSTFGDVMENPKAAQIVKGLMSQNMLGGSDEGGSVTSEAISGEMIEAMMRYMPLRGVLSFAGGSGVGAKELQALIDKLNEA